MDASPAASTVPAAASGLDLAIAGDLDGVVALNVGSPAEGAFLTGTLSAAGAVFDSAGDDRIKLLFEMTGGSAADAFGGLVLAVITGAFGLDDGVLDSGYGQTSVLATLNPVTVIPVPGTLPLLAKAIGMAGIAARRRRS